MSEFYKTCKFSGNHPDSLAYIKKNGGSLYSFVEYGDRYIDEGGIERESWFVKGDFLDAPNCLSGFGVK